MPDLRFFYPDSGLLSLRDTLRGALASPDSDPENRLILVLLCYYYLPFSQSISDSSLFVLLRFAPCGQLFGDRLTHLAQSGILLDRELFEIMQ